MLSTLKELSKYLKELDNNEIKTPVRLRSILKSVDSVNACAYVHSFAMIICNQLFKGNNIFAERICKEFITNEAGKFNYFKQNGVISYPDLLIQTKKSLCEYVGKKLESYTNSDEFVKMSHSVHYKAIINKRNKQEDRFFGVSNVINYSCNHQCHKKDNCIKNRQLADDNILLVGMFDGHNGPEAAEHCHHLAPYFVSNYLQNSLCSKGQYNLIEVLGETHHLLNDTLNGCQNKYRWKAGTTSTMCLIDNDCIYTSWVGDCSAWMIYNDNVHVALTDILHRPSQSSEVVDVWNNGGIVTRSGSEYDRVNGILAVTRALGDDRKIVGVSPLPSVSQCALNGTELCLIVATDGLWDSANCSGPQIALFCQQFFAANGRERLSIDRLCQLIVDRAVIGGASDNISVIVIVFVNNHRPIISSGQDNIAHNVQDARTVRWPRNRRRSCFVHDTRYLRHCPSDLDTYLQAHFAHHGRMQPLLTATKHLSQQRSRQQYRRARSLSHTIGQRFSSPVRLIEKL